ncbi:hypothetical protein [Kribbella sp. NPDC051718]|uniref:hypothetical protein n=1 Tax=Kribbella sp. NPDC051718 TaxID=3155168 RepID=UPI00342B9BD5
MKEDWTRPLPTGETIEIPVRRAQRLFYLIGATLFAGFATYLIVSSGHDPMGDPMRFALYVTAAGVGVYGAGALRMYYGIITGRSRLTIGPQGITLGEHQLNWADIHDITLRPTSAVLRYLGFGPPWVRVQAHHRPRRIDITRDHVKHVEAFTSWLQSTQRLELQVAIRRRARIRRRGNADGGASLDQGGTTAYCWVGITVIWCPGLVTPTR